MAPADAWRTAAALSVGDGRPGGAVVFTGVGEGVGDGVGEGVGDGVGEGVGDGVGLAVAEGVGEAVSNGASRSMAARNFSSTLALLWERVPLCS